MRSVSSLALLGLALCEGVMASSTGFPRRDNSKTVTLPLFQDSNLAYLANITVGTPPQTVTVQIDTGSSDFWVYSNKNKCNDDAGCEGGSYDPTKSSTFNNIGQGLFNSSYGDGSTSAGDYITETVSFGGVTIKNLTMGLATSATSDLPFWGIMGINFPIGEFVLGTTDGDDLYFNLPYWMTAQGLINEPVFSLYLDDIDAKTSTLLFGGIDTAQYKGDLKVLDMVPDQTQDGTELFDFYNVALTAVGAVDSKGNTASFNSRSLPIPVLLDSGSSAVTLPETLVADMYNQLGISYSRDLGAAVPCSFANADITIAFQFGGSNGALIGVPVAEMVTPFNGDGQAPKIGGSTACQFGITAGDDDTYILGDTFLRSAYVVFDPAHAQIGIAQAKVDAQQASVQALTAVLSVPSALAGTQSVRKVLTVTATAGAGGIPGQTVGARPTGISDAQTGRPGQTNFRSGGGQSINPTAAATQLQGGSSIQGIATVYQSRGTAVAAAGTGGNAGAASTSKAAAAGPVSPVGASSVLAALGSSLVIMFAGLGGATFVFAGL